MIKSIKPRGAVTPEYRPAPVPMPPTIDPRSRRIKTIVKHSTQSEEFDLKVNEAIKDGWTLDELRIVSSNSFIRLFASMHRYETEREKTLNEKRAEIGLPPIYGVGEADAEK